jgi:hypothetical protein
MRWINASDGRAIAAKLPEKMVGADRDGFVALLEDDKRAFATDGRISLPAAKTMLEAMTALQPKYRKVKIEDTFTNDFVEKAGR